MSEYEHSGNGTHGNHRPGFGQRVEHIGNSAQQMISEARDAVTDLKRTLDLDGRMERHPYAMLAAAAAVGYVLGGGLLTSMTGRLIRLGLRAATLPFIKDELFNIAETALSGLGARQGAPSPGEPTASSGSASGT
jgi:hypothetical protein